MIRTSLVLLSVVSMWSTAVRGGGFDFYDFGPYRGDVPRPRDFLGYDLGTLHTHHFRVEDYFESLAASTPDRVRLRGYGESYEKKRLFIAVITSPGNLERIDEIRRRNLALADPRVTTDAAAIEMARRAPVIVWLDYGNDGNETAAVEAAMQVAYQLAAGESEEMRQLRENAVIIVEPDHNPESHDRHVAWYNAFGVGDPDPLAMEHHAPWGMSTNNNHFQIDLNRDAWSLTQRENQAIAAEILRWRPQVFVDHHGQTENYFFAPPARPSNPSLPDSHSHWYEVMGAGNARAFDRFGWQYYVRDVFDLYYPGYWDSWPALHGAIAMTYETDGGGGRGLAWRKQDGSIATFRGGIAKHFVASLATIRTSVENREALLRDFSSFFAAGMDAGLRGSPARAFVFDVTGDPRRSAVLAGTLMRHGVEVRRLTAPLTAAARPLDGQPEGTFSFPVGSYLVDMAQPDQRLAETLLDPDPPLDPEFVERQLTIWSRNARRGTGAPRERYGFYDITSWSLPLAFGVQAFALDQDPPAATEVVVADRTRLAGSGFWADEIPFRTVGLDGGIRRRIAGIAALEEPTSDAAPRARSAYLFRPETEGAIRLAAGLLREDFRVAVSTRPLTAGAADFPRGTFVARVNRNPESLHHRVAELAEEAGVEVVASDTAFAARGTTGPGSNAVRGLSKPRVAMIADEGVWITEYGAAWFHLERRLGYPFTPIRVAQLERADIDEFDVIVFPRRRSRSYGKVLGEAGQQSVEDWIERGGTVVGWGPGVAAWLVEAGLLDTAFAGDADDDEPVDDLDHSTLDTIDRLTPDSAQRQPVISPSAEPGAPQPIPGAVVRAVLDPTHWLTFGFRQATIPVLVRGSRFLDLSAAGENPVVFAQAGELHIGGFLWPENSRWWLAGRAYVVVRRHGRGQVILFSQDPNFRLAWRITSRLFSNAVILGPTLGIGTRARY